MATVRARHREVSRTLAGALGALAVGSTGVGVALLAGAEPSAPLWARLVPFGLAIAIAVRGIAEAVVRTRVTSESVEVEKGMRSLSIPLAAITRVTADFERPMRGAEVYMAGSQGVLVEWTDAGGAMRKALVGADAPAALAVDIESARAASSGGIRARVPEEAVEDAETDLEAAREEAERRS